MAVWASRGREHGSSLQNETLCNGSFYGGSDVRPLRGLNFEPRRGSGAHRSCSGTVASHQANEMNEREPSTGDALRGLAHTAAKQIEAKLTRVFSLALSSLCSNARSTD